MRVIKWKSGDCKPVLSVRLGLEGLSSRHELDVFRDQDDLDWFVGAIFFADEIGQVLIMRHDGNPAMTTDFYVDLACDEELSVKGLTEIFDLKDNEVFWRLDAADAQ